MPPLHRGSARIRGTACLLLTWLAAADAARAAPPQGQQLALQALLRARIPASGKAPELRFADGTTGRANPGLPCFYEGRGFAPAWVTDTGPRPGVDELIAAVAAAGDEGLRPDDYHLTDLRQQLAKARSQPVPGELAELDLQLTHAFLRLAADLRYGRVNPELVYDDCDLDIAEIDLPGLLENALTAGNVRQALADLAPTLEGYRALKEALARFRETAAQGGWPAVPPGPTLKPGEKNERVVALRARLEASGELLPPPLPPAPGATLERDFFDGPLMAAVKAFQEKNGLDTDGAIGPATLEALNVTAADRVRQIEINLDRWRWLPRDLGERHVIVNIAGFGLEVVEEGKPVLTMRIVAGKPTNRTPMFSGTMAHVVLNPSWSVPSGILKKEILPKLARDPGYLARQNMEMLPDGGVRQRPGANNALGKVKFLFPNRFNVYLHDTPSRSLFSRTVRTFSHGCIRVERPEDLAEYLLKDDPAWTREKIDKTIDKGRETWVKVPKPLPVHLVYWTAWVDAAGVTQFRKDVYGRDKPLYTEISEPSARKAELGSPPSGPAKPVP